MIRSDDVQVSYFGKTPSYISPVQTAQIKTDITIMLTLHPNQQADRAGVIIYKDQQGNPTKYGLWYGKNQPDLGAMRDLGHTMLSVKELHESLKQEAGFFPIMFFQEGDSFGFRYYSKDFKNSDGPTPVGHVGQYDVILRDVLGALHGNTYGLRSDEPIIPVFSKGFPQIQMEITQLMFSLYNHRRGVPKEVLEELIA